MVKRLVGVGHVALDHVFEVQNLPHEAVKTPASSYRCAVGGMTANAMVAAARLGCEAHLYAPVGDDASATIFAAYLQSEQVSTQGLLRVPGASSSVSTVVVDAQGERLIINHRGSALAQAGPLAVHALQGADLLLTDPRCPSWAAEALRRARASGLPSVLDADAAPQADLQALVPLADWVVFSERGLAAFMGQEDAEAEALHVALRCGAKVAVWTRGAQGLSALLPGQPLLHLPAFKPQRVVDTTAAGDVFHGALGCARAEGATDLQALRFAAAAAALKCQGGPGVQGAPARPEVLQMLAQQT